MTLLIAGGAVYFILLFVANVTANERANPWNTTLADRLWWYPAEIALMIFGWLVMNAPLVAAALLPLSPLIFFVWLWWNF